MNRYRSERIDRLTAEKAGLHDEAAAVFALAEAEGRDLTDAETARVTEISDVLVPALAKRQSEAEAEIEARLKDAAGQLAARGIRVITPDELNDLEPVMSRGTTVSDRPAAPVAFHDAHGNPVRMLAPEHRVADLPRGDDRPDPASLSLGRAVVAMVKGTWAGARAEAAAMGENSNAGGGVLVPEELAAGVIDLARNQTALVRAGASTIRMTSETMRLVRLEKDPELVRKDENAKFPGTDVAFGSMLLTADVIGNYVTLSRELVEDAPNAAEVVQNALAAALAVKLDDLALNGTGSAEQTGLLAMAGVESTDVGGPIDYPAILDAILAIEEANGSPNAYVVAPKTKSSLARLTDADGNWRTAPPDVAALSRVVSKNCPDDTAVVADFSKFLIALRSGPRVEVSTEAGEFFERDQVGIKIVWRGTFGVTHPAFVHALTGITHAGA